MRYNHMAVHGHPMPFDIETSTFFKHDHYVVEELFETCYFIRLVDNLCGVLMCKFMHIEVLTCLATR